MLGATLCSVPVRGALSNAACWGVPVLGTGSSVAAHSHLCLHLVSAACTYMGRGCQLWPAWVLSIFGDGGSRRDRFSIFGCGVSPALAVIKAFP